MNSSNNFDDTIYNNLSIAFKPQKLEVINDSASHAGHASSPNNGNSHFNIIISAEAFKDMSRVDREKAVRNAIHKDIRDRIHALSIKFI